MPSPEDYKKRLLCDRVHMLCSRGLTTAMVVADFVRRHLPP